MRLFRGVKLSYARLVGGNEGLVLPIKSCRTILTGTTSIVACIRRNMYSVKVIKGSAVIRGNGDFCRLYSLNVNGYSFTLTYGGKASFFNKCGVGEVTAGCPGIAGRCFRDGGVSIGVVGVRNSIRLTPLLSLSSTVISVIRAKAALGRGKLRIVRGVVPVSTEIVMGATDVGLQHSRVSNFVARVRGTGRAMG